MKTVSLLVLGSFFTLSAASTFAGTQWRLAEIEKISSNSTGTIQIKLDKPASSVCGSEQILLLPTVDGKMNPLLNRAMFAYTTGEKINVTGTGECRGEFEVVSTIAST